MRTYVYSTNLTLNLLYVHIVTKTNSVYTVVIHIPKLRLDVCSGCMDRFYTTNLGVDLRCVSASEVICWTFIGRPRRKINKS